MFHVLIAGNETVRVYETSPTGGALHELAVFHNQVAHQHERDLVASRPGRVVNRAAGIRQAYDPKVTEKQHQTQRWLKLVGVQLQLLLARARSDALILVASPRMLAELRRHLPVRVRALIHAELARDLAHLPKNMLAQRLQPTLRAAARSALRSQPVYRRLPARRGGPGTSTSRA
jgi:protein required for attachment to host cells